MIQIRMPEAGFSITEGTIIEWYKAIGDRVEGGENVVCVETDKLSVDVPAERSGVLHEVKYESGEVVPVGEVMGLILEDGESSEAPSAGEVRHDDGVEGEEAAMATETPLESAGEARRISPAAKAVARARGIDLSPLRTGSGPHGRIVKQDVLDFIEKTGAERKVPEAAAAGRAVAAATTQAPASAAKSAVSRPGERVEFKGWRKVIADRMLSSKTQIPHYTMSVEADVTELHRMVQQVRESEGLRITYLPFMMKALEVGIEEVPLTNAYCDGEGFNIIEEINMGIAVDLGEKLLVPVVRDVRSKTVIELVQELDTLIAKTREDRLEPRDVEGGTITLTNVGMFQVHSATSVILQPQVSIIYMGTAREVPGVHEGAVEIRRKMIFGATFDHRVVNGASGGRFLMKIKECLENMGILAMHLR
jgi:pyruvate/2-oxoglutarate dehydrogenase complex dihydrolipoamide acyltransferase (E2) component